MAIQSTSRWLWITPEIRTELSTGALVYSMGLARAIAARSDVEIEMVGIGADVDAIEGIDVHLVDGVLRGGWTSIASPLPNLAYACRIDALVERVDQLLERTWDVVVIDGLQAAWAVDAVEARHRGTHVFIAHNHEGSLRRKVAAEAPWRSGRRAVLKLDAWKAARLERRNVAAADVVTTITDADRARFAAEVSGPDFVEVTPGWSGNIEAQRPPIADRPRRVGMLGSYEWHVKQENLRRFLPIADPVFAAAGIELIVGGSGPASFRTEMEPQLTATTFSGWVDDAAQFLGSCRVGAIAEPLGGGFKLKSLDYVFNGVPLACLRGNAEGLPLVDGESMIESDDLAALAHAIVAAIDDPALLQRLATQATAACEPAFSWTTRADAVVAASLR